MDLISEQLTASFVTNEMRVQDEGARVNFIGTEKWVKLQE